MSDNARSLWLHLIDPGMQKLGAVYISKQGMGFEVGFNINGSICCLMLIGWPERDAKNVTRSEKKSGTASIRVNPHIKRIFAASNYDVDFTNNWMRRMHVRGWRGRPSNGMRERWGVVPIREDELNSNIQGIMQYEPSDYVRDHSGRPGDRESLEGLLGDYAELIGELRQRETRAAS